MLKSNQWSISYAYEGRDVQVEAQGDNICAYFRDRKYTVVQLMQEIRQIRARYFYRASFQWEKENVSGYVYYIWQDADGNELEKGYLRDGSRFASPEKAANLVVEVLMTGKGAGSARLTGLEITEEEAYTPRNVRVCTVGYNMLNPNLEVLPFEENVALTLREIDMVAKENPDIIVLTEGSFQLSAKLMESGKPVPNRLDDCHVKALCAKAKEYNCYIVTSLRTLDEDDVLHNTCILIDRAGNIQGINHKTHLTIGEKEKGLELGTELPVFDTDFGRIGMLVCWEHFFPEAVRTLALKGAELLLVPTRGFRLNRASVRALENGIYLVTSHVRGDSSVILDPDGALVADGAEKGYAAATIDLNYSPTVHYLACGSWAEPNNIYLNQRRPELYDRLLQL